MNIEKSIEEFKKYTENYKPYGPKVATKIEHSLRVSKEAGMLAESLNLNKEEIELAKLIGLMHDIGRFEQIKVYNTYKDHQSIDHGDLGEQILKNNNFIRNFIEEDNYDELIFKAIKNHNKFKIEDGLTEKEKLWAKIIRDADKLDIFYEGAVLFWNTEEERKAVSESIFSPDVIEMFKQKQTINNRLRKTKADEIVSFVAYLYDINFEYSYNRIKEKDYINTILNKFDFKEDISFLKNTY